MSLLERIEAARSEPRPWMAHEPRINWFAVIRDACALAYMLVVGITCLALVGLSVAAVMR